MKMSEKICNKCGNKVKGSAVFCPNCNSQSFRNINEITRSDNGIVHKLFYKFDDGYFVLSKSKLIAIIVFILFASIDIVSIRIIFFSLIFAFLFYLIGFSIRKIFIVKDINSKSFSKNNDLGLLVDLMHLVLFWQDKQTGEFVLSKTKLISLLIFLFMVFSYMNVNFALFACVMLSLILTAPVFAIGYGIHRIIVSRHVKKVVKHVEPIIEKHNEIKVEKHDEVKVEKTTHIYKFDKYRSKLNKLKAMYEIKERNARNLIEKRFTPPQLTYDRFIASINNSTKLFNKHFEAVLNILELASHDSEKIDHEINNRINILESLVSKMDELIDELILSLNEDEEEDNVSGVFEDMEGLINSVKDYDLKN